MTLCHYMSEYIKIQTFATLLANILFEVMDLNGNCVQVFNDGCVYRECHGSTFQKDEVEQTKLVLTLLHSHLCSLILWIGKMFWKTHLGDLSTLDYEFWCCSE